MLLYSIIPCRARVKLSAGSRHTAQLEHRIVIEIEYIVKDRKGTERLRTTDKKAADAYDKALENAERLADLLRHDGILPNLPEHDLEELTIYLAQNARNVERILKGKEAEYGNERADDDSDTAPADNVARLKSAG